MSLTVRLLGPDDAARSRSLGWEAFGVPSPRPETPATLDLPGATWFGAFDEAGRLLGRTVDRAFDSCYGGALLPTCGVAGVTVEAEARGAGVLRPLFDAMLRHARDRGAVLSSLYPTAPGIYRGFGYELVAAAVTVEVDTAALAAVRAPAGVRCRRGSVADVPAARAVYDAWALEQNGPLSRRGVSFPASDADWLGEADGLTLAVDDDDRAVGYARWSRGQGYGEQARLQVEDLFARSGDGYRALFRTLGSFATVTRRTRIETSEPDPARLVLPSLGWTVVETSPHMLKVLDIPGAFAPRRFPPTVEASLAFRVAGDTVTDTDGGYRLTVAGGRADCSRTPLADDARVLTPQGLALTYAGAQSSANLRTTGHLSGGDPDEDLLWDALAGGRQTHIRDYF